MDGAPFGLLQAAAGPPFGQQGLDLGTRGNRQHHAASGLLLFLARSAGGFHTETATPEQAQQPGRFDPPTLDLGQRNLLPVAGQQA